jgi:hypothetical protein
MRDWDDTWLLVVGALCAVFGSGMLATAWSMYRGTEERER